MGRVEIHRANLSGRDLAVGDIRGHFSRLEAALADAGFDPVVDRLFSVGDLVDRGPESEQVLAWLAQPWFHAVRGNHDDYAIRFARGNPVDAVNYRQNGGGWFLALPEARQQEIGAALEMLPIALEVETAQGPVGLVHADCPLPDWRTLCHRLENPESRRAAGELEDECIWSRRRIAEQDLAPVTGVRAVVVGHTPLRQAVALGNVYHIDTAGWLPEGRFTLLDLATLEPVGGDTVLMITPEPGRA